MKRKILKVLGITLAVMAVVAVLLIGSVGVFIHKFNPDPPNPGFSTPANGLEAQRQDLAYFRTLMAMDRSFPPPARAEAERRVAALEALDTQLPQQKLRVDLMQIMALSDNGHTLMGIFPKGEGVDVLPLRVTAFADGLYVMRAKNAYRDMLGGQVVSIDNVPVDTVIRQLEALRGGLIGFRLDKAATYAVVQDLLYGLGISPDMKQSVWSVRMPSGATVTRTLVSSPLNDPDLLPDPTRWMSPEPLQGMGPDWEAYRPASGTPPESLQQADVSFLDEPADHTCAAYVRMRAIADDGGQAIQPFIDSTENALRTKPPCAVILDLRYNQGGNFTNTYGFMHDLPKLLGPKGHVYVLTDAMTFSAAITTTAFVKQAGGDRVTILGEPVGDRLQFFAEGNGGCLPNSKLCVYYATGKHDYAQPCTDWSYCYWLLWLYPVQVKTLAPDELIPVRFADWNAGNDLAYERAVELANGLSRP